MTHENFIFNAWFCKNQLDAFYIIYAGDKIIMSDADGAYGLNILNTVHDSNERTEAARILAHLQLEVVRDLAKRNTKKSGVDITENYSDIHYFDDFFDCEYCNYAKNRETERLPL